ncbi:MAG TPA: tetratricopeptide repeat protein [Gemmatimonadales bacterium]
MTVVRPLLLLTLISLAGPLEAQRIKLPMKLAELEIRARQDSLDAAAHYNVALAYWNEKRFDEAERELRDAAALDPRFAEAYLALAYLPYARRPKLWTEESRDRVPDEWKQRLEESDRMYRRAFLVNPLVDLRIAGAVTMPRDPHWETLYPGVYEFYFQAFDDMLQGNYEQAYGRFTKLHRERRIEGPGQGKLPVSFHWFEGLAAAHTQRWVPAKQKFEYLIEESIAEEKKMEEKDLVRIPLRTNEYRYFLANVTHAAGHTERALDLYRKTLENDLGLYMAHVQMANIYEAQRRYPEAIEERQRAVNANPDDPSLVLDLGVTVGKSGKFAEAEVLLQQAAEANPRDPRVPFWMGLCQAEQGKRDEAKASFTRFLAMAPARWDKQIGMAKQRLAALQ